MNNTNSIIIVLVIVLIAMLFMGQRQESFKSPGQKFNMVLTGPRREDRVLGLVSVEFRNKADMLRQQERAVRAFDRLKELAYIHSEFGKNPLLSAKKWTKVAKNLANEFMWKNERLNNAHLILHAVAVISWSARKNKSQTFYSWLWDVSVPKAYLTKEAWGTYSGMAMGYDLNGGYRAKIVSSTPL